MPIAASCWRAVLLALALGAHAALPAPAQEAPEEPTLPARLDPGAPVGATLTARIDRAFDRYRLPVGRYARGAPDDRELEGRVIRSAYRLADPEATTAQVMDGYRQRLAALGYEPVFACDTEACGGFDFRFAVELLPPPAMLLDVADFAQLSARREAASGEAPSGETHVSVLVSRLLGSVYVQTVAVGPAGPALGIAPAPAAAPEDATKTLPPGAESVLLERLAGFGHVRLQGLAFETGSAALTAESTPAIELTARALKARPELSVMIVGHSDNTGSIDDNIALSRRRAETVRKALIARGIDAGRLEARGIGFLAPVASNASDEGRALNRRVELVAR